MHPEDLKKLLNPLCEEELLVLENMLKDFLKGVEQVRKDKRG